MNLYTLTEKYQQLVDISEDLDEETLKDTLDSINEAIEVKVENTAAFIKQIEANANMLKDEEKRLTERRKKQENNAKNMKVYLQDQLEKVGKLKIVGNRFTVAIQNNPASVVVTDEKKLSKYFIEQPPQLNKTILKQDLKNGLEVDGAELQSTRSIRIR